jgi:hypothetical protein
MYLKQPLCCFPFFSSPKEGCAQVLEYESPSSALSPCPLLSSLTNLDHKIMTRILLVADFPTVATLLEPIVLLCHERNEQIGFLKKKISIKVRVLQYPIPQ